MAPGASNASPNALFDLEDPIAAAHPQADDTGDWETDELDEEIDEGHTLTSAPVASHATQRDPQVTNTGTAKRSGTLTIRLPDPRGVSSVAVTCPSGFTGRSAYRQLDHVIAQVPAEPCTLWFRGSSPYKFVGVSGGQTLTCSFQSGLASCE
jgi:hypothetical protein